MHWFCRSVFDSGSTLTVPDQFVRTVHNYRVGWVMRIQSAQWLLKLITSHLWSRQQCRQNMAWFQCVVYLFPHVSCLRLWYDQFWTMARPCAPQIMTFQLSPTMFDFAGFCSPRFHSLVDLQSGLFRLIYTHPTLSAFRLHKLRYHSRARDTIHDVPIPLLCG